MTYRNLLKSIFIPVILGFSLVACQTTKKSDSFEPMAHQEEVLPNGLKLIWIPDEKIPHYAIRLIIPAGSAHDPKGQEGVANMVSSLLDKGTAKRNATRIAADLERLGLSFSASTDNDSTMVGISGLSIHALKATEELYDLLANSQFHESEVRRDSELTQAQLKKIFDNPKSVASVAFEKALYGSHPYGSLTSGSLKSLKGLNRKMILDFYKKHYRPQGMSMAVVGKFGEVERAKVKELFSQLKGEPVSGSPIVQPQASKPRIIFVEKSGLKQAEIRMGHLGIPRKQDDYLKLRVANTILGESFIGKLFSEIREKRGLTYSIYSYFDPREVSGPFVISTFTRLDKIPEMIDETLKVYSDFAQGVSEEDVKDAISYLRGSFPQVIETSEDLAKQLLILNRYGVDSGYLSDFMTNISKLHAKDINGVLKTHFRPQDMIVVVYGPPGSNVGLEKFGTVEKMNLQSLY